MDGALLISVECYERENSRAAGEPVLIKVRGLRLKNKEDGASSLRSLTLNLLIRSRNFLTLDETEFGYHTFLFFR